MLLQLLVLKHTAVRNAEHELISTALMKYGFHLHLHTERAKEYFEDASLSILRYRTEVQVSFLITPTHLRQAD